VPSGISRDGNRKVLLFADNLETVTDRNFLDFSIMNYRRTVGWLLPHAFTKFGNFVYPKELREMDADSAARLLRYELKRQGLEELADKNINDLKSKAENLSFTR